ncbi:hypothetical protein [Acidovorax sp. LjRoot117]|uniref:hypothetical protein n=1 Tax=Acidovorax sp. LjRoot117 TaxID=3342255 RepID=UPI003ECC8A78
MRIEILNEQGDVANEIDADVEFAAANYPEGAWRVAEVQSRPNSEDPRMWWIDVGPFYDRFGTDALAIAASDHGACRAVQTLTGVRKYIDLRDPRIGASIDMLIATNQPTAQPWAPGSGPMTPTKKAAILSAPTTEYERYVKGLGG